MSCRVTIDDAPVPTSDLGDAPLRVEPGGHNHCLEESQSLCRDAILMGASAAQIRLVWSLERPLNCGKRSSKSAREFLSGSTSGVAILAQTRVRLVRCVLPASVLSSSGSKTILIRHGTHGEAAREKSALPGSGLVIRGDESIVPRTGPETSRGTYSRTGGKEPPVRASCAAGRRAL